VEEREKCGKVPKITETKSDNQNKHPRPPTTPNPPTSVTKGMCSAGKLGQKVLENGK